MPNRKKIVLILPRGEAIRNFVLSGTAALLRQQAYVVIISVFPNKEIELILKQNSDELHELIQTPPPPAMDYFWDWIDIVHGWWIWSGAAKLRWQLRDSEADSIPKKLKRNIQKIFAYPFKSRRGVELLTNVAASYAQDIYPDKYYRDLFKKIKPDLVFNGSHIHSRIARPAIHAARKLNIKTATFLFSWDNLTSQGRIIPGYDFYMVWNNHVKNDLLNIYSSIKPENVAVVGTPQFDFHFDNKNFISREEYCKILGADPERPIILYSTGMLNLMPGEEVIVERIADICKSLERRPQLLVRVYPKETSGRFNTLKEKRNDIIFPLINWEIKDLMPMPSDIKLFSNMLLHCDLGINVASTVSLELCMFNKPVINIGYNPPDIDIAPKDYSLYYSWEHYKPVTDSGAVAIAWSEDQIPALIENALSNPEEDAGPRKRLIEEFFGPYLDGNAYKRIADYLLNL
jgi:hypothetical protein